MRIEWQRDELRRPSSADPGEPLLVEAIRAEISSSGPITFARFMQRALYEPGLGYYATAANRPTRAGDYLTAAELHPIFGRTLARQVDEIWRRLGRPDGFVLREFGAGSGALFLAVLDGLLRNESPLALTIRYQPIDLALQTSLVTDRLTAAGHAGLLDLDAAEATLVGCVIANEFVDALPVHRVIQLNGELREIHVDWRADGFIEVAGPLTDPRLAATLTEAGAELGEGWRAEVNVAQADWIARVGDNLERGALVVIDYGANGHRDSLRAFREQHVSSDPLQAVGHVDITADVDFDALERQARAAGLDVLGRRRAAEFLLAAGIDDEYQAARSAADDDWEAAIALRSAVRRLLDPGALGGYQVAILGRGIEADPPLAGLRPIAREGAG